MLSNPNAAALPEEISRYMAGVANNNPDVFAEMARMARGLRDGGGVVEVGDAIGCAFTRVLTRWAKAFHYKETGSIVPINARIHVAWFSNANAAEVPPAALTGRVHDLRRNGKNIGDQFAYITRIDPTRADIGYYTAAFRRSFLAILLVDYHGEIIGSDRHG
jgi:hypothetical protein